MFGLCRERVKESMKQLPSHSKHRLSAKRQLWNIAADYQEDAQATLLVIFERGD